MFAIRKEENLNGYCNIEIETEEGIFKIFFLNNGDLYWDLVYAGERLEIPDIYEYIITKDNYYLYNCFEKLYKAIEENKPYSNSNFDREDKNKELYNNDVQQKLFKDGKIEWHSDEFYYDESSVLTISKNDNTFRVQFKRSTNNDLFTTYDVKICNSGSRYYPFNVTFMNMYNKVLDYDLPKKKIKEL